MRQVPSRQSSSTTLPNLYLLGAAKCGTTTLATWLQHHPDIFVPKYKEPEFYSHDPYYNQGDSYLGEWYREAAKRFWRCDATPHYLLHAKVAHRISRAETATTARFICIFRDPVNRAHSLYWNLVAEAVEVQPFEVALQLESERLSRPEWRAEGRSAFAYVAGGLYHQQLLPYLQLFPIDRFLFLCTEDLAHPVDVLRRVAEFLDVPPFPSDIDAAPKNSAFAARSNIVQRFVNSEDSHLKAILRPLVPWGARRMLMSVVKSANRKTMRYPEMEDALMRRLRVAFADDLTRLEILIGRDLSAWRVVGG